ncbi:hypothetical protein ID866_3354 [Astraeus odoratus]|nr:hypothetical protein ID866_3354 [Astraeus odoratus]
MSSKDADRISAAQQTLDSMSGPLYDISQLLNTQLDRETLATCVGLIESGVNPEALAVRVGHICLLGSPSPRDDRLLYRNYVGRRQH